jgi:hypothetical protein
MATEGGGGSGIDPKAAKELAASVDAVKKTAVDVTRSFDEQLKIITSMRDAMAEMVDLMDKMTSKGGGSLSPEGFKKVTKEAEKTNKATKTTTETMKGLSDVVQSKWAKAAIVGTSALTGLHQGFKNLTAITKGVAGFFGSIVSGAFSVAKSIVAIPFKMLGSLIGMAESGGGGNELREAYENVREEFGSLKSTVSSAVISSAKDLNGFKDTGLSAYMTFGNLAERIKFMTEMAKGMGAQMNNFSKEMEENGGAMAAYQKGLGLTAEQMGTVAQVGTRMGSSMSKVLNDMTKQSVGMSKAFGVNAKIMSKDMAKAMQDVAHFGHLSTKELGLAAAFANKLGVSVDKLTGLMDATSTFDQAAEGMSKLNEQYGTNIDASKVMMAQNPGEKFAIIAKGFKEAGKDMSKLSYQDRQFIKTQSGLTDELLDQMVAGKDISGMYDKMSKQADKNENKTLSQADAMHELADSIKQLTPSGGGGGGGFMDHIIDGFMRGMQSSKEFVGLMHNIRRVLREATQFGIKLGHMFVDLFPGVKDVFGGLKDLFDPGRFKRMFDGVLKAFDVFKTGGTGKMEDFMDKIQTVFTNFFDEGKPAGAKVLNGFKKFGEAIVKIFGMLSKWVIEKLAKVVESITKFITSPPKMEIGADGVLQKVKGPFDEAFKALKEKLYPALKELVKALFDKLKKAFSELPMSTKLEIGAAIAGVVLGPAITQAFVGGSASAFFSKAAGLLTKGLAGGLSATDAGAVKEVAVGLGSVTKKVLTPQNMEKIGSQFAKFGEMLGPKAAKAIPVVGWAIAIADAAVNVSASTKKFGDKLVKDGIGPAEAKIGAGATGLINALTFGLLPEDLQYKIAKAIAKMSEFIFKGLDNVFGPGFSDSIKQYFSSAIDVFGGLGDLLSAMWNGDSKGVNEALIKIGKGLWGMIKGEIEFLGNLLLKIGPIILEYLYKALGWVSNKIGDIFLSLKDLPLVGFIFDWIGQGFKLLGDFFNKAGVAWGAIADIMKKLNVTQMLRDWGNAVIDFAKLIWDKFTSLPDTLVAPFKGAWAWIKENISIKKFKEIGNAVVDGLMSPINTVKEKVTGVFSDAIGGIKDFLGIRSPSKVFADLGGHMVDGMMLDIIEFPKRIKENVSKAIAIVDEIFVKVTDSVRKNFNLVFNLITEITDKIMSYLEKAVPRGLKIFQDFKDGIFKIFGLDGFLKLFENIVEGVKKALGKLADSGPFQAIIAIAKKVFQIQSPSKVFEAIGDNIADGMDKSMSNIPKDAKKHFDKTVDAASNMQKDIGKQAQQVQQPQQVAAPQPVQAAAVQQAPAAPDLESTKKLLESLKQFGDLADANKETGNKIWSFNNAAKGISWHLSQMPNYLNPIIQNIKIVKKLLEAEKGKSSIVDDLKTLNELMTGLDSLGTISEKMSKEELGSKIWLFNVTADGIAWHLKHMPESLTPVVDAASKLTEIMSDKNRQLTLDSVKKTTEFLTVLTGMGDASAKIVESKLQSKTAELNTASVGIASELSKMPVSLKGITDNLTSDAFSKLPIAVAEKSIKDFQKIIAVIQTMDDLLVKLPKVNLSTRLAEAAGKLGLGSSGVYTVKSREVVINVEFNVTMDAGAVEKAVVMRSNSVIRDRINYLLNDDKIGKVGTSTNNIPNTPSNVGTNISGTGA